MRVKHAESMNSNSLWPGLPSNLLEVSLSKHNTVTAGVRQPAGSWRTAFPTLNRTAVFWLSELRPLCKLQTKAHLNTCCCCWSARHCAESIVCHDREL